MKTKDLLFQERSASRIVNCLLIASLLTGLTTYVITSHSVWIQWTVLAHILTGATLSFVMLPYFYVHFRRTLGFRRAGMVFSGILLLLLFLICAASGWHIIIYGQLQKMSWVYETHVVSTLSFIIVLVLHLLLHVKFLPAHRKSGELGTFPSVGAGFAKFMVTTNIVIQAMVLLATLIYSMSILPASTEPAVLPYEQVYGPHPFRPSQTETHHGKFVAEEQIANSQMCLSCHQEIGQQWMSSVHQQAASDPSYVTNITLLAKNKGISATRYCEGCHAPVALLTGQLTPGGEHGGIEGTLSNSHGISCMSCHGVQSLPHIKGVASYEFTPAADYLFANNSSDLLSSIHNKLLEVRPQQHKRDVGHEILADPKSCAACHTQFMDKDLNNWGWIQMQNDYGAWLASPFSRQHEENFANQQQTRCQDCHMPLVPSDDPSANDAGLVRSHNFAAANTFLPLLRNDTKQFEAVKAFLQQNKLRVNIDKPSRNDLIQSSAFLDESLRDTSEIPMFYYLGETATIQVIVSNIGIGHNFPGGTIDINQAWVEFAVHDAQGSEVYLSGGIDLEGYVDEDAHFYRSLPIDKTGKLVWRHDLFNMVGNSFKRVIPSGKSDIATFSFDVAPWIKSPLTVVATVKYRKLNNRYAKWALQDNYIEIPAIDMAWDSVTIPVKIRKTVD